MKEHGVPAENLPPISSLYNFAKEFAPFLAHARMLAANEAGRELSALAAQAPGNSEQALYQLAKVTAFNALADLSSDPDTTTKLVAVVAKLGEGLNAARSLQLRERELEAKRKADAEKNEIASRRLALLEAKAAQATQTLTEESTDAERVAKMRAIFGISA